MIFTAFKVLHLLSLMMLFGASAAKNVLLSRSALAPIQVYWCRKADKVSGAAAGVMVLSGIGLIYSSAKGSSFYFSNDLFWAKMLLLFLASALIIRSKVFFRQCEKHPSEAGTKIPSSIRAILRFDAFCLVAMLLLAVLVAGSYSVHLFTRS